MKTENCNKNHNEKCENCNEKHEICNENHNEKCENCNENHETTMKSVKNPMKTVKTMKTVMKITIYLVSLPIALYERQGQSE